VATATKLGMELEGSSAFDPINNKFIAQVTSGTWSFDPSVNNWIQKSVLGTPPPYSLAMASATFDNVHNKMFLFGGRTGYGEGAVYYNDLYSYDVASNTWTKLNPGGARPAARQKAGFAFDSQNGIILLFGGINDSGIAVAPPAYGDTWAYSIANNTWTQLNPPNFPPAATVFERLSYDPVNNVFLMVLNGTGGYANSSWTAYGVQTWAFRYGGTGPDAGTLSLPAPPTFLSLNRNKAGWAAEPVVASTGTSLFAGWIEMGATNDSTTAAWAHLYANKYSNGSWSTLGSQYDSISSEANGATESHEPSMAVVGGVPWVTYYSNNNSGLYAKVYAKYFDGSQWIGGIIGTGSATPYVFQGRSQLLDIGGTPYVGFLEEDKNYYPAKSFLYVKSYDGISWQLKGTFLNRETASTLSSHADSLSLASDGTNPIAGWTEYTYSFQGQNAPQVYVSRWNGSQWVALGGSLNMNPNNWAQDAAVAYLNGQIYVAWVERSAAGNAQLYMKVYANGAWTAISPNTLNKNSATGWSFRPSLVADVASNSVYVGWVEQDSIGKTSQAYVSRVQGSSVVALGSSLNFDSFKGSSQRVKLALLGGQPVAVWGEVQLGTMRQMIMKSWNGSSWVSIGY
jgi:hypothetical protein